MDGGAQDSGAGRKSAEERRLQIVRAAEKLFSRKGFHATTIEEIALEAGVSKGLIYVYFEDKTDVLFLTLRFVLEIYEREIPTVLEGLDNPLERLVTALRVYCSLVDTHRDATLLAYRSTMERPGEQRSRVKLAESRTTRILAGCIEDCARSGLMKPLNTEMLAYQCVMFCHGWALKYWAFRDKMSVEDYVLEGIRLLIDPHLIGAAASQVRP
jgi:AcrR family transcriptional regulator